VINAAFTHANPLGHASPLLIGAPGYAAFELVTAKAEVLFHNGRGICGD